MATRKQNEREFGNWEELPNGGRRYWRDRPGRVHGSQRMVKIVDADENTIQVVQEIYNDEGVFVQRHQKYPEDTGHEILTPDEDTAGDEA